MSDPITTAAKWLAAQQEPPQPIIRILRDRFSLTGSQAAVACTKANEYRKEKAGRSCEDRTGH
jgi:hypothetical protein